MATAVAHPYIEALLKGYEAPRGGASWLNERRGRALELESRGYDWVVDEHKAGARATA